MKTVKYAARKKSDYSELYFDKFDVSVMLSEKVISHFRKHQQKNFNDKEAGGQLFARFKENKIVIEEATGPRLTDKRSKYKYQPNRSIEQLEINKMFKKGLHFIGDWHTHYSRFPTPSDTDLTNINSCVNQSAHELNAFIMIIVGYAELPQGLHISFHQKS